MARGGSPILITFPGLIRNIPVLEKAAAGRGLLNIQPEADGIGQRVPLVLKAQGQLIPKIAVPGRLRRRPLDGPSIIAQAFCVPIPVFLGSVRDRGCVPQKPTRQGALVRVNRF